MSDLMPLLAAADLSGLADREGTWFATGRGRVFLHRYARHGDFVRAAVRSGNDHNRAALLTFHPAAYPLAPAWLAAIAAAAPDTADHRPPSASTGSVRLLARMTPDHRNGIPRLGDGSVGWSLPGAAARIWPNGRPSCAVPAARSWPDSWRARSGTSSRSPPWPTPACARGPAHDPYRRTLRVAPPERPARKHQQRP